MVQLKTRESKRVKSTFLASKTGATTTTTTQTENAEALDQANAILSPTEIRAFDQGQLNPVQRREMVQRAALQYGNQQLRRVLGREANAGPTKSLKLERTPSSNISTTIQRHSSWEHRLLGDVKPNDLDTVVRGGSMPPKQRYHVLEQELDRMRQMQSMRPDMSESELNALSNQWGVRLIRLKQSGIVLTYGEMNTMPDYFVTPEAVDNAHREAILPIVQGVRREGYTRIQALLDSKGIKTPNQKFAGATGPTGKDGTIAAITQVSELDTATKAEAHRTGHDENVYRGLLSRNACHFAPFSWYRWSEHHQRARELANEGNLLTKQAAHLGSGRPAAPGAENPATKMAQDAAEKKRQADLYNGYADHFLQDSFASGHLINKTLIMQWFVEWVKQRNQKIKNTSLKQWFWKVVHGTNVLKDENITIDLQNMDKLSQMTTDKQPDLAGRQLYHPGPNGQRPRGSADPQTAEERGTRQERMAATGVRGGETQYQNYFAFMDNAIVQEASGALHNYFNDKNNGGLWVSSPAVSEPYQVYGDDSLLEGGEGVKIIAETAQMSQKAIENMIAGKEAGVSVGEIFNRFPNKVMMKNNGKMTMTPLEQWNDSLKPLCEQTIFPSVHYRLMHDLRAFGTETMGKVSQDQR